MKVFVKEMGWRGCLIAIAETEEDARRVMGEHFHDKNSGVLKSYPLDECPKLLHVCLGDS